MSSNDNVTWQIAFSLGSLPAPAVYHHIHHPQPHLNPPHPYTIASQIQLQHILSFLRSSLCLLSTLRDVKKLGRINNFGFDASFIFVHFAGMTLSEFRALNYWCKKVLLTFGTGSLLFMLAPFPVTSETYQTIYHFTTRSCFCRSIT